MPGEQLNPVRSDKFPAAGDAGLRLRRIAFLSVTVATGAGMTWLMASTLFDGRADALGIAMMFAFLTTLPWTVVGFWNALIGFALMTLTRGRVDARIDWSADCGANAAVTASTALLVCVRNEQTARLRRNLGCIAADLAARPEGRKFDLYVLSDSSEPAIAAEEERIADELARRHGERLQVIYRRRSDRLGYKAGNIRDFCERWGAHYDYAIVLDADSVMTAEAMLRLVRLMQRHAHVGIVQTLVTGLPSASAFARIFQFGMRLGMRSHTLGAASWQADCGPYWGHNAIIRLAPFIAHCDLPRLPNGTHILSHDQIEAALMRRAGYQVRVLIEEEGSWEENPPHLAEFMRRDRRWCQGNMQYIHLLGMRGLLPVSRIQIALAIAMYLSPLGWISFLILGMIRNVPFRHDTGLTLFAITLAMTFAPKIATVIDVLTRRHLREAFGGAGRVLLGVALEIVFWMLLAPVCAVAVAIFLLGMPLGLRTNWTSQERDAVGLPLVQAARKLWPQTILGCAMLAWLIAGAPGVLWWLGLPVYVGLAACIPFATLTAHPGLGRALTRAGICRIPEEAPAALDLRTPRPFASMSTVAEETAS